MSDPLSEVGVKIFEEEPEIDYTTLDEGSRELIGNVIEILQIVPMVSDLLDAFLEPFSGFVERLGQHGQLGPFGELDFMIQITGADGAGAAVGRAGALLDKPEAGREASPGAGAAAGDGVECRPSERRLVRARAVTLSHSI